MIMNGIYAPIFGWSVFLLLELFTVLIEIFVVFALFDILEIKVDAKKVIPVIVFANLTTALIGLFFWAIAGLI